MPFLIDETKVKKLVIKDSDFNHDNDFDKMNQMEKIPADQDLFADGSPKASDVEQGDEGSCYLLAPLRAIAGKHPEMIKDMFHDNKDGTVTVRFYQERENGLKCPVDVTVDKTLPNVPDGRHSAPWVLLFEKAYIAGSGRDFANKDCVRVTTSDMRPDMHFLYLHYQPAQALESFFPQAIVKNNHEQEILQAKPESQDAESRFHDYQVNLNDRIKAAWKRKDAIIFNTDTHAMTVADYHEDPEHPEKSSIYVYDQRQPNVSRLYTIEELTGTLQGNAKGGDIFELNILHSKKDSTPTMDVINLTDLSKRMRNAAVDAPVDQRSFQQQMTAFIKVRLEMVNHVLAEGDRLSAGELDQINKQLSNAPYHKGIEDLFKEEFKGIRASELAQLLDNSHPNQEKVGRVFERLFELAQNDERKENEGLRNFLGKYRNSFTYIEDKVEQDVKAFCQKGKWSEGAYLASIRDPLGNIQYADPNEQPPEKNEKIAYELIALKKFNYENTLKYDLADPDTLSTTESAHLNTLVVDAMFEGYREREKNREAGLYHGEDDAKPITGSIDSKDYADELQKLYRKLQDTKSLWSDDSEEFEALDRLMETRTEVLKANTAANTVGETLLLCRKRCEAYQKAHQDTQLSSRQLRRLSVMSRICELADQFEKHPVPREKDMGGLTDERIAVMLMNSYCTNVLKDDSKQGTKAYMQAKKCMLEPSWRKKYVDFMCKENAYFQEFCKKARKKYAHSDTKSMLKAYEASVAAQKKAESKKTQQNVQAKAVNAQGKAADSQAKAVNAPAAEDDMQHYKENTLNGKSFF